MTYKRMPDCKTIGCNLLKETEMLLSHRGMTLDNIVYMGINGGGGWTDKEEILALLDLNYNDNYGSVEIKPHLILRLDSGDICIRWSTDEGMEGWKFIHTSAVKDDTPDSILTK